MVETVTLFKSIDVSKVIYITASDFENANQTVSKIKILVNKGKHNEDVARYISDVLNLTFQGVIANVTTREQSPNSLYINMQNFKFRLMVTQNHYTNPNSFHLCFQIKIKKEPTLTLTLMMRW